jgi:hypothetical protein
MDNTMALVSEENDDSIQQPNGGERGENEQKAFVEEFLARQMNYGKACDNAG